MAKAGNVSKSNIFIHENCGGEIKGFSIYENGKLKNKVRCSKCKEERWSVKDFDLDATSSNK